MTWALTRSACGASPRWRATLADWQSQIRGACMHKLWASDGDGLLLGESW